MPFIIVGKPMSDLCWQCQQNSSLIMKAVNKSAREKSEVNYSEYTLYHFCMAYMHACTGHKFYCCTYIKYVVQSNPV